MEKSDVNDALDRAKVSDYFAASFNAKADRRVLAEEVGRLQAELAALREQSAREHEAWRAIESGEVSMHEAILDEGFVGFSRGDDPPVRRYGRTPVDAVLAVVEAMKQDAAEPPGGHGHDG